MGQDKTNRESHKLRELARKYKKAGYRVFERPSSAEMPPFLVELNYQPDLLVIGEEESLVVEIKSASTIKSDERLAHIADKVRAEEGWDFVLVMTNPREKPEQGEVSQARGVNEVKATLDKLEELSAYGQLEGYADALPLAWAAVEGMIRFLLQREYARAGHRDARSVIRDAVMFGLISRNDSTDLESIMKLRDNIAHGFSIRPIRAADVDKLVSIGRKIVEQSQEPRIKIQDDIDQYIAHFRAQNQEIARVSHPVFRKILYVAEIDTLSRAAFSTVKGHRKRVVQFIDSCSNWSEKDRVSAVQLKLLLEENQIYSGPLCDRVKSCIASWGYGSIIRPNADLTLAEVEKLVTPDQQQFVNDSRYAELLYTYRNHLVHEFRQPGYGMEISDDPSTPYYHGMEGSPWELVFPGQFLHDFCERCIIGLETYLMANNLNPYDSYQFGTMWRRS